THRRALPPLPQRITLAEHRPPRGEGVKRSDPHPEEQAILQAAPEISAYNGAEAEGPQSGRAGAAATAAPVAGISARAVAGGGGGSRPVWALRSGSAGEDDSAASGARLLSTAGNGAGLR